jgi:hypothetical protein
MYLDREVLIAVQKLEQQRKTIVAMMLPEELAAMRPGEFAQRPACQRPVGDDALVRAVVHDLPALRIVVAVPDRLA